MPIIISLILLFFCYILLTYIVVQMVYLFLLVDVKHWKNEYVLWWRLRQNTSTFVIPASLDLAEDFVEDILKALCFIHTSYPFRTPTSAS